MMCRIERFVFVHMLLINQTMQEEGKELDY